MTIQYKTKGVCSRQMNVKIENGVIQKVDILGGCAGNSQGVARLVEGMRAEDAIEKIVEGFADCIGGGGQTSGDLTCPGVPIG